jgi:hypothetical protein
VLYTRNIIAYRDNTLAAIGRPPSGSTAVLTTSGRRPSAAEREIDDVLTDSFPASDPPSWNPGITRLHLDDGLAHRASGQTTAHGCGRDTEQAFRPLTSPGQRAEDGGFFKGWSPSLEQRASRWWFRS